MGKSTENEIASIEEQLKILKTKNISLTNFILGLMSAEENEKEKAPEQSQMLENLIENKSSMPIQFEIIEKGEQQQMKYKGITIHKHKTCKTWYARYRDNGIQHYLSARTQQECYDKLKITLKKIEQRNLKKLKEPTKPKEPKVPKSMSFIEWYNKWLELYKKDVKSGTLKDYKCSMNYLTEIFNKPMNQITSIDILEKLNQITFKRRKQLAYELLKSLFDKAFKNEIIQKNVMLVIDKPKHTKINGNALSNEDETKLEKILIEKNADMFLVCLYQGLRRGEMLALTIEDIDFEKKTLSINKSLNQKSKIDVTKNIYSNRVMPLFDKTLKILEKYKNVQGRIFDIGYITCERRFREIVQGVESKTKYTIHSLRHTFVTRCQEQNIPLHIIQRWVGHNIGSEVTSKVYTHTRERAELENIEKMNNCK